MYKWLKQAGSYTFFFQKEPVAYVRRPGQSIEDTALTMVKSAGNRKRSVLILCDYYLPSAKAGGPIRSLQGIIDNLSDEYQFKLITRDRDFGETLPYPDIKANQWTRVDNLEILYLSPDQLTLSNWRKILTSTEYDLLYLNSFFSPGFSIRPNLLQWLRLVPARQMVLAPRGELSECALKLTPLKFLKKQAYLFFARAFHLYSDTVWQASSQYESEDIVSVLKADASRVMVAEDILSPQEKYRSSGRKKISGDLQLVFLSRISRNKNLHFALELLDGLSGTVCFDIYGPIEDQKYWRKCQRIIRKLPDNISVRYCGVALRNSVVDLLGQYDLFLLPTLGENFGHAILESLSAGCPVLISDQTPWRKLKEKGIGWDLPLNDRKAFQKALQHCVDTDEAAHSLLSEQAGVFGKLQAGRTEVIERNRLLFGAEPVREPILMGSAATVRS